MRVTAPWPGRDRKKEQDMAKGNKEVQEEATVTKAGLPAGVKIVDGAEIPLDAATIRKVMEG